MQAKVAFLSVVQRETSAVKARNALDALMVSTIFKFAAETVRRRITWESLRTIVGLRTYCDGEV